MHAQAVGGGYQGNVGNAGNVANVANVANVGKGREEAGGAVETKDKESQTELKNVRVRRALSSGSIYVFLIIAAPHKD